jgi:hypothetical protein
VGISGAGIQSLWKGTWIISKYIRKLAAKKHKSRKKELMWFFYYNPFHLWFSFVLFMLLCGRKEAQKSQKRVDVVFLLQPISSLVFFCAFCG